MNLTRSLLADISLLRRPALGFVGLGVVLTGLLTSWMTRDAAAGQTDIISRAISSSGLDPSVGVCQIVGAGFDPAQCLASAPAIADTFWLGDLLRQSDRVVEAVSATSLSGLIGFAARQSASMIGFVALTLVICIHISVAWEQGTARPLLAATGSKCLIAQKLTSSVVLVILLPILSCIGVAIGSLLPISGPIPLPRNLLVTSFMDLLRAYWILLVFAVLVVAIALLARNLVGSVLAVLIPLMLSYIAANSRELFDWSPSGWIANFMQFSSDDRRQVIDFFWVPALGRLSPFVSGLILAVFAIVALGIATIAFPRRKPIA